MLKDALEDESKMQDLHMKKKGISKNLQTQLITFNSTFQNTNHFPDKTWRRKKITNVQERINKRS